MTEEPIRRNQAGQRIVQGLSLLSLIAAAVVFVELVLVLREPQRWILVPYAWMKAPAIQRLLHVLLNSGPAMWAAFCVVAGMELDAIAQRKSTGRSLQLDRLSFLAFWFIAYLGGSAILFHLMRGHWSGRFLIISPYLSAPVLLSHLWHSEWMTKIAILAPYASAPLTTVVAIVLHQALIVLPSRQQVQKFTYLSLLIPWTFACLIAVISARLWPLLVPSASAAGWVIAALLVEGLLAILLWRWKAERLEQALERFSRRILQKPLLPVFLLGSVLIVTASSGVSLSTSAAKKNENRPNVILISVDALRADHMGIYGYPLKITPEIDNFAAHSTVFTQCISTAPYTAPAVWSLMTSEYRTAHSVGVPGRPKIIPDQQTLARVLSKNGYLTAAFVSNSILHHRRRFWQGFKLYDDTYTSFTPTGGVIERTADKTNQYVFNWLDSVGDKNFFLWIHYQDPHGPYMPPEQYLRRLPGASGKRYSDGPAVLAVTDNDGKNGIPAYQHVLGQSAPSYYRTHYDGEIAYADDVVGDLLERINDLGLLENSIIIITADHGEAMGEHGYYFCHGHDLTEELIHIPLIMHIPGVEQGQVA